MKKTYLILIVTLALLLIVILLFLRGDEDSWIKNEKGIWIKHGNPSKIPEYVEEQKNLIQCANNLYFEMKLSGTDFNSQCLGRCMDYSIDMVNIPRTDEDNKLENQCMEFKEGLTKHFIELDNKGEIVRIV